LNATTVTQRLFHRAANSRAAHAQKRASNPAGCWKLKFFIDSAIVDLVLLLLRR
jgi:hypothetical protein